MEQEVRDLIEGYVAERRAVLDQIDAGWTKQAVDRPRQRSIRGMAIGRP